jgi:hypothetical protein
MPSARDEIILWGLVDWVALERIHWFVARENPSDPVSASQTKTLNLIRSLVTDGLFSVGDLNGEDDRFRAWDCTLDEAIQRIRSEYIDRFEDTTSWPWFCWLAPTDKGIQVARELRANVES